MFRIPLFANPSPPPCVPGVPEYYQRGFTHNPPLYGKVLFRCAETFRHRDAAGYRRGFPVRVLGIELGARHLVDTAHVDHRYGPHPHRSRSWPRLSLRHPPDVPFPDSGMVPRNLPRRIRIAPARDRRNDFPSSGNDGLERILAHSRRGCRIRFGYRPAREQVWRRRSGIAEVVRIRFQIKNRPGFGRFF